jgi:hypothetical protein
MAQHAPGMITGSTCNRIMTGKDPGKLLAGAYTFALEIALERLELVEPDGFAGNYATEWGNMYEAEAIQAYEAYMATTVTGKQEGVRNGWLSCTPDGVDSDTLIEVK